MTEKLRSFALIAALIVLVGAVSTFAVYAQNTTSEEPNPNAQITFPPPVYVLRGAFEVRGTVAIEGMFGYYLEYRPLNDDLTPLEEGDPAGDWLPATIPSNAPVIDDVIGEWDTEVVDDGLYELRLVVLQSTNERIEHVISPLRVENEPPPFVIVDEPTVEAPVVVITTEPQAPAATQEPASGTGAAQGTALVNGNVRQGDSTAYSIVTALQVGQTVPVIGRSNTGSGWWLIRLPDGRQGFVAPNILNVTGDTANVPLVSPPPPPSNPQPTTAPGATSTPTGGSGLPDAQITSVRFDRTLVQGQPFQIFITVRNESAVALPGVAVACNFTPQNQFFSGFAGGLAAFSQVDVAITAQLDSGGGGNTTANCAVDVNNLVAESNEANNFFNITVALSP